MKISSFSDKIALQSRSNKNPLPSSLHSQSRKMIEKNVFYLFLICSVLSLVKANNPRQANVVVRISNMTESMQQDAIRITKQAFVKFNGYSNKSRAPLAQYITYQMSQLHQSPWQCILGRDYGLSITTENEKRIILDVGNIAVLIFKGKC